MTFLPIVARELSVAARRRGTYWTRAAVASAAVVIGGFFYLGNLDVSAQQLSGRLFLGLLGLALVYCLVSGRRWTADCLSEEKREGTLGLLFLTDLKGYDVVLGKLAATSLNGFYGLLAFLPVLAVPLLMGGITSGEFWRVVLVLVNTFLFSLAAGMFVSALSRDAHKAMGANLVLLVILLALPAACAGAIHYFLPSKPFIRQLLFSCPAYSLYLCDDTMYYAQKRDFWWSLSVLHGLTWVLLAAASGIVTRSWQEKAHTAGVLRWRDRWHAWLYGDRARRTAFRKHLLNINAFFWLAARARFKPLQVWILLFFVAGWWAWASIKLGTFWAGESLNPVNVITAVMLNLSLKLWIAMETGRQLAEDHKAGALELLLSTPLTVSDIARGQFLALRRQFLVPVLLTVIVQLLFLLLGVSRSWAGASSLVPDQSMVVGIWLGGILMLLADASALFWVALQSALTARSPNLAIISTVLRILALPWVILWVVSSLARAFAGAGSSPGPGWKFYLPWWFGLGLAADLYFGLSARRQLRARFRQLAAQSSTPLRGADAMRKAEASL